MTGKPYIRDVPRFRWFLRQPRYMRYMAREVTCIFIGAYAVVLLVALQRLAEGRQAYEAFLQALASPVSMVFHLVVLVFALYHTTSWFNVTPKAMPIQAGEDFLPGAVIVGAHYAAWLIVSVALLFLAGVF
jgi:fumarate reductase subunit C